MVLLLEIPRSIMERGVSAVRGIKLRYKIIAIKFSELDVYHEAVRRYYDPNPPEYIENSDGIRIPRNYPVAVRSSRIQFRPQQRKMRLMRFGIGIPVGFREVGEPRKEAQKNMTLREYIESLEKFISANPEADQMKITDTYDDDPCELEIVDGTIVFAEVA